MKYENLPPELKQEKAWVNVWNNSKIPMQSSIKKPLLLPFLIHGLPLKPLRKPL